MFVKKVKQRLEVRMPSPFPVSRLLPTHDAFCIHCYEYRDPC